VQLTFAAGIEKPTPRTVRERFAAIRKKAGTSSSSKHATSKPAVPYHAGTPDTRGSGNEDDSPPLQIKNEPGLDEDTLNDPFTSTNERAKNPQSTRLTEKFRACVKPPPASAAKTSQGRGTKRLHSTLSDDEETAASSENASELEDIPFNTLRKVDTPRTRRATRAKARKSAYDAGLHDSIETDTIEDDDVDSDDDFDIKSHLQSQREKNTLKAAWRTAAGSARRMQSSRVHGS